MSTVPPPKRGITRTRRANVNSSAAETRNRENKARQCQQFRRGNAKSQEQGAPMSTVPPRKREIMRTRRANVNSSAAETRNHENKARQCQQFRRRNAKSREQGAPMSTVRPPKREIM